MPDASGILAAMGDGLIAVVKRDCPTCELVGPVLAELQTAGRLAVYSQDDPAFPEAVAGVEDDRDLDASYRLDVEIVPTLIRVAGGREVDRTYGWDKAEWARVAGRPVGQDLPTTRPGCGAANVEPTAGQLLKIRYGETGLVARRVNLGAAEDPIEAAFVRGWSDGLPVTPPTEERVLAMLEGTSRPADEIVGIVPPNLDPCTVEKAAINAVMAGCKPEYFPVVLAALEAVLDDKFNIHGVLATTMYVGPVLIVNGPIAERIGMNARHNALGQGNRANLTIGRAVQLIVRNVGGGKPGGIDRAALGSPWQAFLLLRRGRGGLSLDASIRRFRFRGRPERSDGVRRLRPARRRRSEVPRSGEPGALHGRQPEGAQPRQALASRRRHPRDLSRA